jgi:hypothetical protein
METLSSNVNWPPETCISRGSGKTPAVAAAERNIRTITKARVALENGVVMTLRIRAVRVFTAIPGSEAVKLGAIIALACGNRRRPT